MALLGKRPKAELGRRNGFTLTGVMMMMSLSVVVSQEMMSTYLHTKKSELSLKATAEADQLVRTLRKIVEVEETCTPSLLDQIVDDPIQMKDPFDPSVTLAGVGSGQRESIHDQQ